MSGRELRLWIIIALALCGQPAGAATVTLVADIYCPYNCVPGSDKPGFMIEIAQRALAKGGHAVNYRRLPWTRAVIETRRGVYDGVVAASVDGSAGDFVFPEVPTGVNMNAFLVRKDSSWRYASIESLEQVKLGVVLNYSYETQIDAYVSAHRSDPLRIATEAGDGALAANLRKLKLGQIGALIDDKLVLEFELATSGVSHDYEFAGTLETRSSYIAFTPSKTSSAEYAQLLSEGVTALRSSGELNHILARYGLHDWKSRTE